MEMMQLEMFVAVVEERSVRGAAERVFRTQPAVSIAVRKLEEEVNAPLFDRSKRYEYRLTEVGEALYSYATRLVSLRNEAISTMADLSHLRTGRLRVGANESISMHLLPQLTQEFLKRDSGVRIELRCESSARLVAGLKDRRLDLALLSFQPEDAELESQFLTRDELVLITNPKHPFASRGSVHVRDLGQQTVIVMDVSSAWHQKMVDTFIQFKAPLNLSIENAPIETIKKMVAIGLGVGFVPLMCVRQEKLREELAVVGIEGFHQERSLYVVKRRAVQSHAVKAFVQVAVSFGNGLHENKGSILPTAEAKPSSSCQKNNKVVMVNQRA